MCNVANIGCCKANARMERHPPPYIDILFIQEHRPLIAWRPSWATAGGEDIERRSISESLSATSFECAYGDGNAHEHIPSRQETASSMQLRQSFQIDVAHQ